MSKNNMRERESIRGKGGSHAQGETWVNTVMKKCRVDRTRNRNEATVNMCGSKVRYATKELAEQAAQRRIDGHYVDYLRAYQCPVCGGWHLTHKHPFGEYAHKARQAA